MKETISVIIPAYNCGGYNITRAIKSAVFQNAIAQIIVVDDGSTDETPETLKKVEAKYSKVEVIYKANGGVSSARNMALNRVQCDCVAFLDADDELDPDFAQRALNILNESDANLVIGSYEYRRIDGRYEKFGNFEIDGLKIIEKSEMPYMLGSLFDASQMNKMGLSPMRYTGNWSMLASASLIKGLRFRENLVISEDRIFNYELFMRCSSIAITPERFYIYNQTEGSASQKYRPDAEREMIATASAILKLPDLDNEELRKSLISGVVECFEQAIQFSVRNCIARQGEMSFNHRAKKVRRLMDVPVFIAAIQKWDVRGAKGKLVRFLAKNKKAELLLLFYDVWDYAKSHLSRAGQRGGILWE